MTPSKPQSDAWNFRHCNFAPEWFDGLPLGNGDLGALMMADHKVIKFPLAKSDLWDERCDNGSGRRSFQPFRNFAELRSLIEREKWSAIEQKFEKALAKWKGKFALICAGNLVLRTDRFEKEIEQLDYQRHLDMRTALASNTFTTRVRKQHVEALVSVEHQVLAIRVRHDMAWRKGNPPRKMTFGMDIALDVQPSDPKAKIETGVSDGVLWRRVRGYHEVDYTVAVLVRGGKTQMSREGITVTATSEADFTIYVAISSNGGASVPLAAVGGKHDRKRDACATVRKAAAVGYDRIQRDHVRWWRKFWSASRVQIPDQRMLRQYHFGLYLLGTSSRRGYQMPGLQGLWYTRPPGSSWNEYTNDLNIQMCYWPVYASNHLALGWPYYDTVRAWLPETRRYTREYWGCRGVQFSCCASPTGVIPPGYLTTMHWAGHAAFVAQNFWTHWLYSRDETFLREVAYPFLKECAEFYLDFLRKNKRGGYDIWPSNTPEAGEGSYEAWGKNVTMDIALLKMLFGAIIESAQILGCDREFSAQCRERLEHLPPYPMRDGALIDMESKEFRYSHRHNGMLTPIYPCADMTGKAAVRSVDRFAARGKWLWGCHTLPWQAAACARIGRGNQACDLLREMFEQYFPPQGGFNLNYNYHRQGEGIVGRAVFCNESNSGYSAALLEMLIQSHNDLIRVFPAVPRDWKDASFEELRAEGAFLVSASMRAGKVREVRIRSERGGSVRVRNPWTGKIQRWTMKRGEVLRLRRR